MGLSCWRFAGAELGIMKRAPPGLEPEPVDVRCVALEPPVPFWETDFMRGMDSPAKKKAPLRDGAEKRWRKGGWPSRVPACWTSCWRCSGKSEALQASYIRYLEINIQELV